MSILRKFSFAEGLERALFNRIQSRLKGKYQNVQWISYHIPKTAGTSFRSSLEDAFGRSEVYGVYQNTGANAMSGAETFWIPDNAKVLHGHFRPHKKHKRQFANARSIIWLRDPVKRTWSLLRHTLEVKNNAAAYNYVKQNFLDKGITDEEEMFLLLLEDPSSSPLFNVYERYLASFKKAQFSFVGSVENYDEDLNRLSGLMDRELVSHTKNARKVKRGVPDVPVHLMKYFDNEYKIYHRFV